MQAELSDEAKAEILKAVLVATATALVPVIANAAVDAAKRFWTTKTPSKGEQE